MTTAHLASRLGRRGNSPAGSGWPDHEYVRGWGLLAQAFESGDVLALRVFPEGTFGGFCAVWHRDPAGRWSIHVDSANTETACLRYFGAAAHHTGPTGIRVDWTGPASVRVTMDRPSLDWTFTASTTPVLDVVNAVNSALPQASWRHHSLVRARELAAWALGLGRFRMTMTAPSGHYGTLMPAAMYFVDSARAVLEGRDLGRPVRSPDLPRIGAVELPARAVLATGQVVWRAPVAAPAAFDAQQA
ncbi:MAG: hypothetical protein ACJ714_14515 [Ornithinibacter sp.]